MQLLIEENYKRSVRSLYDDRLSLFPDSIPLGDTLPIEIGLVARIGSPWSSRLFTPQALTSTTFRAALGLGFVLPVAGSFPIAYGANTAEDISYNPTADEIETAINLLASVIAAGGIDVTGEEGTGFYVFTWRLVGARTMLSGDASDLVPLSLLDFQEVVAGTATVREVQTLRILQNAGAINTLSTAAASAGLTLTNPQDGGAGVNEQYRVALTGNIYKGSWTLSKTGGGTSAAILADDTEAQIKAKLEATTGIGSGNVSVAQEDERTWLIEFIGTLAATAITVTASGANLVAIPELTGTLDLRGVGARMLLNGSSEKVVTLEIEKTVGAAAPVKVLQRDVLLVRPVIEASMTDQATNPDFVSLTPSAVGSTDVNAGYLDNVAVSIIAAAGAGAYTYKLILLTAGVSAGAEVDVYIEIAASTNPTIEVRNATSGGTLLHTVSGDSSNITYQNVRFRFNGTAWVKWTPTV